jgi:hypothetical protein
MHDWIISLASRVAPAAKVEGGPVEVTLEAATEVDVLRLLGLDALLSRQSKEVIIT